MTEGGEPFIALTIAGSDSGGAAGMQADLKTFTALGVYGMSVITTITAQNSLRVAGIRPLSADFVALQLNTVLSDYGAHAVKTGFIGQADVVEVVAQTLSSHQRAHFVVDPVLVNHKGESMFAPEVTQAYIDHLLPLADLVTPNLREASLLTGQKVEGLREIEKAAHTILTMGPKWVLVTGGRIEGSAMDVLCGRSEIHRLCSNWIESYNTHGSGDTLSAAVCAYLAMGSEMRAAVERARHFTHLAIQGGSGWRLGGGHGPVSHW